MTCGHLRDLEAALQAAGVKETYRGAAWGDGTREWVYFDCILDLAELRRRYKLADCVVEHIHRGTHSGREAGFICEACHDAIMGRHPEDEGVGRFP